MKIKRNRYYSPDITPHSEPAYRNGAVLKLLCVTQLGKVREFLCAEVFHAIACNRYVSLYNIFY